MRSRPAKTPLSQTRVMNETRPAEEPAPFDSTCACLIFIAGERIGRKLDLDQPEISVGRDPRCSLPINSDLVSRNHAKLLNQDGQTILFDLESTNGSFVNDERVSEKTLVDGDRIAIGKVVMKYLGPGSAEAGYHDEVYRLVSHDGLTDLYNKRFFDEQLAAETSKERLVSVIVFDADHFKKINDTYGHAAGDAVLRQLAGCARSCVDDASYLARIGGEEFSVLLPGVAQAEAVELADKIRQRVSEHPFVFGDLTLNVHVSLGVATREASQLETGTDLFKRADEQLYRAKREGRNRVCA